MPCPTHMRKLSDSGMFNDAVRELERVDPSSSGQYVRGQKMDQGSILRDSVRELEKGGSDHYVRGQAMVQSDMFGHSVKELEAANGRKETSVIDKYALDINLNPAMLVGNLLGGMVGTELGQRFENRRQLKKTLETTSPIVNFGKDHVEEVQNISKNMDILFTPLSVLYTIRINNQIVTLDNIDTEEMDDEMYDAWKRRDAQYFKSLMLNKMMSEMQLVEQMYAKRLLQKKINLQNTIQKKSSEELSEEPFDPDMGVNELFTGMIQLKEVCEKSPKFVEIMSRDVDPDTEYMLSWNLDRPIKKYASILGSALQFVGLDTSKQKLKETQDKLLKPSFLSGHLKIAFMPDRILFIVDNFVVTQLAMMDMNEEGVKNFREQNHQYFKDIFLSQAKKGIQEMNPPMTKKANLSGDISEIFRLNEIHPMIYAAVLDKKYKGQWINNDPEVIVSHIENDFGVADSGIGELVLNKILAIQAVRKSSIMFEDPLYFEKCVRAMNDRPIDFDQWQADNTGEEIMWTMQIMDVLTPGMDVFDHFSDKVLEYIVMSMVNQGYRTMYVKQSIINSPHEQKFFDVLNEELMLAMNADGCEKATSDEEVDEVIQMNITCADVSRKVLQMIRKSDKIDLSDNGYIVQQAGEKAGLTQTIINATKKNVRLNIGVDLMIDIKDSELKEQKALYNL